MGMGSLDARVAWWVFSSFVLSFGASGFSFFLSFFHLSIYSFTCFGFGLGLVLVLAL
ncbi:hypothetical protein B0H13DRAFT_2152035, partial [Mycena leptocephala]